MLLDICFGSKAVWRILLVLTSPPGRGVSREEIKKFTKLGGKMLTEKLKVLSQFDIIIMIKEGKKSYYKLNLANEFSKQIIEMCDLEKRKLNGLDFEISIIIREFTRQILNILEVENIIVFGSYVKRTFHKESDIDVGVITKEKIKTDKELLIEEVCDNIEKRFHKNIQTHVYTKKEFEKLRKKGDKIVESIIRDGIKIL